MSADGSFAVRGLGLRLAGVAGPDDLLDQVTGRVAVPAADRRFVAPDTDLAPLDRRVHGPVEVRLPDRLPTRGLRGWPHESLLALAAAAQATPDRHTGPDPAAVLWASSTAGLAEYAAICTDAALLEPGLSSPLVAPASAHNGPASTVSVRLGRTGPVETLLGGPTAGLSALVEAVRLLAAGEAPRALVGASASLSRWSLAGATGDHVPAEGAVCLAVEPADAPDASDGSAVVLRGARRVGLDPDRLGGRLRDLVDAAGPVDAVVLSTPDPAVVDALAGRPVWHVERRLGDLGAAGGLLAVVCAVARCRVADRPANLLALAVEPTGNASIVEVSSSCQQISSSDW
ncbi:beta-ketoacyl synthase N-terminal-like domain-containing protein [Micromonospora zhanjiangensis]|uniref:Beta-ketoacyl synthase N-terminal-like domain-containing protein n=1 Tax=Micromonospora zhanjiangensis TaxID=1522057 RepID=A0ABV8KQJ7_9ACTN